MSMFIQALAGIASAFTPRTSGLYLCMPCDVQFNYSPSHTSCPSCSSQSRDDVNALYIEEDAECSELIQSLNFGEGD
jgi:hypothetical protein